MFGYVSDDIIILFIVLVFFIIIGGLVRSGRSKKQEAIDEMGQQIMKEERQIEERQIAETNQNYYCPICGTVQDDTTKFCSNCGAQIVR